MPTRLPAELPARLVAGPGPYVVEGDARVADRTAPDSPDAESSNVGNGRGKGFRNSRSSAERKAAIEQLRNQQRRKERRTTILIISAALAIALALIAIPASSWIREKIKDSPNQPAASFGVAAAQAGCDAEIVDEASGESNHVDAGQRVDYELTPPSSGSHAAETVRGARGFYGTRDAPAVERLVHNLEHGYLVAWYNPDMPGDDLQALSDLSKRMRNAQGEPAAEGKFIASPWPGTEDGRPPLPEGKNVVLVRWGAPEPRGAGKAWRQACSLVSGEAVAAFAGRHPASDAPEPVPG